MSQSATVLVRRCLHASHRGRSTGGHRRSLLGFSAALGARPRWPLAAAGRRGRRPSDKAIARQGLLRLSDFPAGWTQTQAQGLQAHRHRRVQGDRAGGRQEQEVPGVVTRLRPGRPHLAREHRARVPEAGAGDGLPRAVPGGQRREVHPAGRPRRRSARSSGTTVDVEQLDLSSAIQAGGGTVDDAVGYELRVTVAAAEREHRIVPRRHRDPYGHARSRVHHREPGSAAGRHRQPDRRVPLTPPGRCGSARVRSRPRLAPLLALDVLQLDHQRQHEADVRVRQREVVRRTRRGARRRVDHRDAVVRRRRAPWRDPRWPRAPRSSRPAARSGRGAARRGAGRPATGTRTARTSPVYRISGLPDSPVLSPSVHPNTSP